MAESLKRRLLAGGVWVLAGKFVTALSRLLATGLLARLLPQETLGAFGLAFSVVNVGVMAAQLGLQQAIVRLVAESLATDRPGRARAAIRFVFRYCTVGLVVVVATVALGGGAWFALRVWDSPVLAASMGGVAAWIAVWGFQVLLSETFRGFQDLRSATIFGGAISWGLAAVVLICLARFAESLALNQVILIVVGTTLVSLAPGVIVLRRRVRRLDAGGTVGRGEVLSIALPMWITLLTAFAMQQFDLWILGAFVPKADVAVYFSAVQLVVLVSMSLILVNLVVPPFIADLYVKGERRRLERILRNTATLAGLPALVVLLAFVFFGGPILGLVYGPAYRDGASVLALLSLGRLVNVLTGSCGIAMGMTGHQTHLMVITLISSLLTVGGCLFAVQPFGLIGVAAVVCVGTIVQNVAMWLATRRFTGMWTHVGLPRWNDVKRLLS